MADREKVINAVECCLAHPDCNPVGYCACLCPYGTLNGGNGTCLEGLMEDALSLLEAQEPGWISVKDFLPGKTGSTLICTKNGAVCTAKYYKGQQKWNGYAGKNAAYWMPLPEPPKEEI